jgi:hypothetical protein
MFGQAGVEDVGVRREVHTTARLWSSAMVLFLLSDDQHWAGCVLHHPRRHAPEEDPVEGA